MTTRVSSKMKRAVIVAVACGSVVVIISLLGVLGFMYKDDPIIVPYMNSQAPTNEMTTHPLPDYPKEEEHTDLAVEQTTASPLVMIKSSRLKIAAWIAGSLIVAGMIAGLVVLILRRHEAVLMDAIANDQSPPSTTTFILNTFNPRSNVAVVTSEDPLIPIQNTTSTTEQYALLVLCVGLTFGLISFVSTLISTLKFERAAISGFKSVVASAIGQAIILSVIIFL